MCESSSPFSAAQQRGVDYAITAVPVEDPLAVKCSPAVPLVLKAWLGDATKRRVRLLVAAAAVGLVHAAFTVYRPAGGRWLLRTVGAWVVELADRSPAPCAAVLGVVAVFKIAGAVLPLIVETRPITR